MAGGSRKPGSDPRSAVVRSALCLLRCTLPSLSPLNRFPVFLRPRPPCRPAAKERNTVQCQLWGSCLGCCGVNGRVEYFQQKPAAQQSLKCFLSRPLQEKPGLTMALHHSRDILYKQNCCHVPAVYARGTDTRINNTGSFSHGKEILKIELSLKT